MTNPDEEHHEYQHSDEEHSNILMFILGTQQHSDGQNVHLDFQVNRDQRLRSRGITPLDTLQRLYEPKNSINRDQRLSITSTIAKHS